MSLGNTSHLSVKHCSDKLNAKYIHGGLGPELVQMVERIALVKL